MKDLLGILCIQLIQLVRFLPSPLLHVLARAFIPAYWVLRPQHTLKLLKIWKASPYGDRLSLMSYYAMRFRFLIRILKQHGNLMGSRELNRLELFRPDYLVEAMQDGKPTLLVGLHMGQFELLHQVPGAMKQMHQGLYVLVAPAFARTLTSWMNRGRSVNGNSMILNTRIGRYLPNLPEDAVLATMVDQSPIRGEEDNETMTLWDRIEIPLSLSLIKWVYKQGGCVLPVSTWDTPEGTTRFEYHPPLSQPGGTKKEFDPDFWRLQLAQFIEAQVDKAPEQWNWSYPGINVRTS